MRLACRSTFLPCFSRLLPCFSRLLPCFSRLRCLSRLLESYRHSPRGTSNWNPGNCVNSRSLLHDVSGPGRLRRPSSVSRRHQPWLRCRCREEISVFVPFCLSKVLNPIKTGPHPPPHLWAL